MTISNSLFQPTRRLEHFRRAAGYLRAHAQHLAATGAGKRELATLAETLREIESIIAANTAFPLDDPQPQPAPPRTEQPLVPVGAEDWMRDFINELCGDDA